MNFYVLTLFPEMIEQGLNISIIGRALDKKLLTLQTIDIRDFAENKHNRVDDYPYGGGAGMVMAPGPVYRAYKHVEEIIDNRKNTGIERKTNEQFEEYSLSNNSEVEQPNESLQVNNLDTEHLNERFQADNFKNEQSVKSLQSDEFKFEQPNENLPVNSPEINSPEINSSEINTSKKPRVIYLTPQGKVFNQEIAEELAKEEDLVFLCGHYEGIDERALEMIVTDNISIGDYVLTGGELPSMVMIDAISRLVPGVLNNNASAEFESLQDNLLEYPQYTRPEEFMDKKVPEVLLSGHHANIEKWRKEQSIIRTATNRPDLLEKAVLNKSEKAFLEQYLDTAKK